MVVSNEALVEECEAVNAIYGGGTVELSQSLAGSASAVLKPPDLPFSFRLSFPTDYPDAPPSVHGTTSTGSSGRGEGNQAVAILVDALSSVFTPGQVCLFDLVEEAAPRLRDHTHDEVEDTSETAENRSANDNAYADPLTDDSVSGGPPPSWITTDALVVNKSTFVARALHVSSMADVTNAVSHLLSTNKKVASATHNIKAWRLTTPNTNAGIQQDYDEDGETAAGGRLLHLMQLMGVENALVVVTRWYGGVKLGPDRFRIINNVARDALVKGGFLNEENSQSKKPKK